MKIKPSTGVNISLSRLFISAAPDLCLLKDVLTNAVRGELVLQVSPQVCEPLSCSELKEPESADGDPVELDCLSSPALLHQTTFYSSTRKLQGLAFSWNT